MWLDEQLRWRLSNTLDLSLGGLQQKREKDTEEREEERDGGREEREREWAVSIDTHQSDGSMRYLTIQANPLQPSLAVEGCLLWGGWLVTMSG